MLLVLIGLRGSGKTTLAPILAGKLGYQWLDLDAATLAVLGETSVVDAWKHHGENGCRAAEAVALRDALSKDNYVIACGGGTPTAPGATAMLTAAEETGKAAIVYLRGSIETLQQRLRDAGVADRPGLTGADPIAEVPMLFMKRDPLYMSIASCTVAIDGQTVEQTVENIGWMLDATEDEAVKAVVAFAVTWWHEGTRGETRLEPDAQGDSVEQRADLHRGDACGT